MPSDVERLVAEMQQLIEDISTQSQEAGLLSPKPVCDDGGNDETTQTADQGEQQDLVISARDMEAIVSM